MIDNRPKPVSLERVITLINCYGANTHHWPENERVAAISLIRASTDLQQRLSHAQQLDDAISDTYINQQDHISILASKIIDQLPDNSLPETLPVNPKPLWRKSNLLAVGFSLLLACYFIFQLQPSPFEPLALSRPVLDQWMLDEVTLNIDDRQIEELTFMVMVELET